MKLFSTGKLRISGNIMASQKLEFLQKIDPEEAKAAVMKARAAGGPGKSAARAVPATAKEPVAPRVFAALEKRLAENPKLRGEVQAVVQFYVKDPDGEWAVDLASATPSLKKGEAEAATAKLIVSDDDLGALARGEVGAQELYQRGKLRVDGDITVAHRLGFMKGLI